MEFPTNKETISKYQLIDEIWNSADIWHSYSHSTVAKFLTSIAPALKGNILMAGSANCDYGLDVYYLDICGHLLPRNKRAVVGNIEQLPFGTSTFDAVICVGSVINYCHVFASMKELARVTKVGAALVIDVELSGSLEYINTPPFRMDVYPAITFYNGMEERIWVYSRKLIRTLLRHFGFIVVNEINIHTVTPIAFRLFGQSSFSKFLVGVDRCVSRIPLFHPLAGQCIFLAKKIK